MEVDEVYVDGVSPAAAVVHEFPELDGAAGWAGEDAVRDVVEGYAVDSPLAVPIFFLAPKWRLETALTFVRIETRGRGSQGLYLVKMGED